MNPTFARSLFLAALAFAAPAIAAPGDYFAIRVIDADTGRGVPLAELKTTYKTRYYTDSGGYIAFLEPGLAGQEVWFDVSSYGYESPKGPFGMHGLALRIKPGDKAEIKLKRISLAERLYRVTGFGTYRDTELLGLKPPINRDLLPGLVTGQDTIQTAIYRGKMYWMWQDTDTVRFPLGNFAMTTGTSALPDKIDADKGIEYEYFVPKPGEFVRSTAVVKREGTNPLWIDGLMVVKDASGNEKLLGRYAAANKDFSLAEEGLVLWNDDKQLMEGFKKFPTPKGNHLAPVGHPFRVNDGGKEYYYISSPFPNARVLATFEMASDLANYEGLTCLQSGSEKVNRDASGKVVWTWQRGGEPISVGKLERLVKDGSLKADEHPFAIRNTKDGKAFSVAGGSIAWNPYLKKWTFLFGQKGGDSMLGEIWFATANAPEGPWRDAVKVATHAKKDNNNDLYNPMQHPELAKENGKVIYFEGTFVNTFSGNPAPTPYYDYNQLMYRLDLSQAGAKLPEPLPGISQALPVP